MKLRRIISSIAIFLSLTLVACQNTTNQQPKEIITPTQTTNSNSQKSRIESAKKIVALTSLSADIIHQLDKSKLVGIAGSSLLNKNPEFKDYVRVSEGQTPPNLEKIVALKPDLVIGAEGFSNQTIEKIKQLGIPTLLTKVDSWESFELLTKNLAQSINADPQPLLKRYQTFLDVKTTPNISTLVLVSRQPILSPNKSSWAGNLLTKFQAKNITADLQASNPIRGYITLSAEKVLEANPEVLIIVNPPQRGSEKSALESFKQEAFWSKLQAVKNNRVYVFDYYGLVNAGSIDAIEKACKQLQQSLSEKK
ncbi:MAG: ABC transporter substrate-binding protein [Cyanomargarita calcarea GSE-NOS-MK-12-04C]|jgi:iron complex transport system substrate-binding protein|uniref:ABC transporter substrate-binding protein n=1 Tax=Cyanomargarita calcarea GSE-NOS-MK-12-04C TaxID=2839659 RepID=A0A951QL93_9CYAN|nr:ABC transporter substrate-binding protein [Cyanomargarita calcarea GSE-NOS-MK-12-04C]